MHWGKELFRNKKGLNLPQDNSFIKLRIESDWLMIVPLIIELIEYTYCPSKNEICKTPTIEKN